MKKQTITEEILRMQKLAGIITENEMEDSDKIQNLYNSSPEVLPWNTIEKAYQESGLTGEEFFADFEDEFRNQFEGKPVSKEAYLNFYADRSTGGQDDKYIKYNWVNLTNNNLV
jgi:hypothetical protein